VGVAVPMHIRCREFPRKIPELLPRNVAALGPMGHSKGYVKKRTNVFFLIELIVHVSPGANLGPPETFGIMLSSLELFPVEPPGAKYSQNRPPYAVGSLASLSRRLMVRPIFGKPPVSPNCQVLESMSFRSDRRCRVLLSAHRHRTCCGRNREPSLYKAAPSYSLLSFEAGLLSPPLGLRLEFSDPRVNNLVVSIRKSFDLINVRLDEKSIRSAIQRLLCEDRDHRSLLES